MVLVVLVVINNDHILCGYGCVRAYVLYSFLLRVIVLRKTKQTSSNCFDAVTQSDPLPAVRSLSAMRELHKGSLICVRGYVFDMLVLWERCFQMLKPSISHTTNARAVLVKKFPEM